MSEHYAVVVGRIGAVDRPGRRLKMGDMSICLPDSIAIEEAALPVGASAIVAYEVRDGERWAVEVRVRCAL